MTHPDQAIELTDRLKPLTAADIHATYNRKVVKPEIEADKQFRSTKIFDRDPAHSGAAPQGPERRKGKYSH